MCLVETNCRNLNTAANVHWIDRKMHKGAMYDGRSGTTVLNTITKAAM